MPRLTLVWSTPPAAHPPLLAPGLLPLAMAALRLLLAMLIHGPLRGIHLALGNR